MTTTRQGIFGAALCAILSIHSGAAQAERKCRVMPEEQPQRAFTFTIDKDYGTISLPSVTSDIPKEAELRCSTVMSQEDPMPFPVNLCHALIFERNYTQSIHLKLGTKDGSWEAPLYAFVTSVTVFNKDLPIFPDEVSVSEESFPYSCTTIE